MQLWRSRLLEDYITITSHTVAGRRGRNTSTNLRNGGEREGRGSHGCHRCRSWTDTSHRDQAISFLCVCANAKHICQHTAGCVICLCVALPFEMIVAHWLHSLATSTRKRLLISISYKWFRVSKFVTVSSKDFILACNLHTQGEYEPTIVILNLLGIPS